MQVLIDANVLIDFLTHREPFYENAKRVISCCLFTVNGCIAPHSFVEIFYVLHEREKRSIEECRESILKLCAVFDVASENKATIINAAKNLGFNDFEDALQNEAAITSSVDYIITRNKKDFVNSVIPVLLPEEFLQAQPVLQA